MIRQRSRGAEESLHGEEKPLWKHGLFTSIVPMAKVAYFAKKQFSVFSQEKSGDFPGLFHETSNTKWRGGHLRLTQQTNDKDRMRIGVSWPIVECSRLYEPSPPHCEKKFRFWILAVAHFTYGSRDLNFYLNIR